MRITIVASILLALITGTQAQEYPAGLPAPPPPDAQAELIATPDGSCISSATQPAPVKPYDPQAPIEWKPPQSGAVPAPEALHRAPEPVTIETTVEMKCAGGKILVHVTAPVEISNYTSKKIPVTMELALAPGAVIDLRSIDVIDNESGFALVGEPQPRAEPIDGGGTQVTIELTIQSFEIGKPYLPLSLTLKYATMMSQEGTPIWQDLVTSELRLLHHDTVPPGAKARLIMASHDLATPRISWAYIPSLVIAFTLIGLAVLLAVVRSINRLRPRQSLSPQLATWLALDDLIVSGNKIGFTQRHYEKISAVLKTYLKTRYTLTSFELRYVEATLSGEPVLPAITGVLQLLQSAVYNSERLSAAQHNELLAHLRTIVPKPLSL